MGCFNSTPKIKWPKEIDSRSSDKVTEIKPCTCTNEFTHAHAHPTSSCQRTKSASFIASMGSRSTNTISKSNSKSTISLAFSQAVTLKSVTAGKMKEDEQDKPEVPSRAESESDSEEEKMKRREVGLISDLALQRKEVTHLISNLSDQIKKYATLLLRSHEQTMKDLDEILGFLPSGSAKIHLLDLRGFLSSVFFQQSRILEDGFKEVAEGLPVIWDEFCDRGLGEQRHICLEQHKNSEPICAFRALTVLRRACEGVRGLDGEMGQRVNGLFEEMLRELGCLEGGEGVGMKWRVFGIMVKGRREKLEDVAEGIEGVRGEISRGLLGVVEGCGELEEWVEEEGK